MKPTLKMLITKMSNKLYQKQVIKHINDIYQSSKLELLQFIKEYFVVEANPIPILNLVFLFSKEDLSPVLSLQIINRLICMITAQSPLKVQVNVNNQIQDTILISFVQNPQNQQILNILQFFANMYPELLLGYLMFFWPDDYKSAAFRQTPTHDIQSILKLQNDEIDQSITTIINGISKMDQIKQETILEYSQFISGTGQFPSNMVPSSVLIHLLSMCITEKTAHHIIVMLLQCADLQISTQATIQILLIIQRCLMIMNKTNKYETLQNYSNIVVHFMQFASWQGYSSNSTIKLLCTNCVLNLLFFCNLKELFAEQQPITQLSIKQVGDFQGIQTIQQFITESRVIIQSPIIRRILNYNVDYRITGEFDIVQTCFHAQDFISQIVANCTWLSQLYKANGSNLNTQFVKSTFDYSQQQFQNDISLTQSQHKQIINSSLQIYTSLFSLSSMVDQKHIDQLKATLLHNLYEEFTNNDQLFQQLLMQFIQNSKTKLAALLFLEEFIIFINDRSTQNNQIQKYKDIIMENSVIIINYVMLQDLKFIGSQQEIKYKIHDTQFYQSEIQFKQALEQPIVKIVVTLLSLKLIKTNHDFFMTLVNILIEAASGQISGRENTAMTNLQQLAQQGYEKEIFSLIVKNLKDRIPIVLQNDTQAFAQGVLIIQSKILLMIQNIGEKIDPIERLKIFNIHTLTFSIILSKILIIIAGLQKFEAIKIFKLLYDQVFEQIDIAFFEIDKDISNTFLMTSFNQNENKLAAHQIFKIVLNKFHAIFQMQIQKIVEKKQINQLFPGLKYRNLNKRLETQYNIDGIRNLKKSLDDEDLMIDIKQQTDLMDVNEIWKITTFWIAIQIVLFELLSIMPQHFSFKVFESLSNFKFNALQLDEQYKSIYLKFQFLCIQCMYQNVQFQYEQLNGNVKITDQNLNSTLTNLKNYIIKVNSEDHTDNLKYLIQSIAATNLKLLLMVIRQLKESSEQDYQKLIYTILMHCLQSPCIKSLCLAEQNQQKPQQSGIFVPNFKQNKYIFEIICQYLHDLSSSNLYKTLNITLCSALKCVKYLMTYSKIEITQMQQYAYPLLCSLIQLSGFGSLQNNVNVSNQRILPSDQNGITYIDLAKSTNYSDLIEYYKKQKNQITFGRFELNSQYQQLIRYDYFAQKDSYTSDDLNIQIGKMQAAVMDSIIDILQNMKLNTDLRKIILYKVLSIVDLYVGNKQMEQYLNLQLLPRILMILTRLLESQCNNQMYFDILNAFQHFFLHSKNNELYIQLFCNFSSIGLNIINNLAVSIYVLKKNNIQYTALSNPVCSYVRYQGPFGNLPPASLYMPQFICIGKDEIIMQLIQFDKQVRIINNEKVNQKSLEMQYICESKTGVDSVTSIALQILDCSPKSLQHNMLYFQKLLQIEHQYFQDNECEVKRFMSQINKAVQENKDIRSDILQCSVLLFSFFPQLTYIQLQKFLYQNQDLIQPYIHNLLFNSDDPINVKFSIEFSKMLKDNIILNTNQLVKNKQDFVFIYDQLIMYVHQFKIIQYKFEKKIVSDSVMQILNGKEIGFFNIIQLCAIQLSLKQIVFFQSGSQDTLELLTTSLLYVLKDKIDDQKLVPNLVAVLKQGDIYRSLEALLQFMQQMVVQQQISLSDLQKRIQTLEQAIKDYKVDSDDSFKILKCFIAALDDEPTELLKYLVSPNNFQIYNFIIVKSISMRQNVKPNDSLYEFLNFCIFDDAQPKKQLDLALFILNTQFDNMTPSNQQKLQTAKGCMHLLSRFQQDLSEPVLQLLIKALQFEGAYSIVVESIDIMLLQQYFNTSALMWQIINTIGGGSSIKSILQITNIDIKAISQNLALFKYDLRDFKFRKISIEILVQLAQFKAIEREFALESLLQVQVKDVEEWEYLAQKMKEVAIIQ